MTDKEKELIDLIAGYQANGEDCIDARDIDDLAKAIIAKYPQLLAEKVWEGSKNKMIRDTWGYCRWDKEAEHTDIEIYIREVKQ